MEIHHGKVVSVKGGKYDGQAAQVKRIYKKTVDVMISGQVVRLKKEALHCGES
jgi:ribosomal protein L24